MTESYRKANCEMEFDHGMESMERVKKYLSEVGDLNGLFHLREAQRNFVLAMEGVKKS